MSSCLVGPRDGRDHRGADLRVAALGPKAQVLAIRPKHRHREIGVGIFSTVTNPLPTDCQRRAHRHCHPETTSESANS